MLMRSTNTQWKIAFNQGQLKEDTFTAVSWNDNLGLTLRDGLVVGAPGTGTPWFVDERAGAPNYSL